MLENNQIIEIQVNSLAYGGESIGKIDGFTVFVEGGVPEDVLNVKITSVKKSYAKATIVDIVKPSQHRVKPPCAILNACGGCQWQQMDYDYQLKAKQQIVKECLERIGKLDVPVNAVIPAEKTLQYRCKVQYPIGQTKVSKRFLAGYYQKGTHEIVNIKHCPIQPKIIDVITQFIRDKAQTMNFQAYNEKRHNGLIRHIVYRYSQANNNLLVTIVVNATTVNCWLNELCQEIKKEFKQVVGVCVNFNTAQSNVIMGNKTEIVYGQDFIEEKLDDKTFKISAGSFFQVNPLSGKIILNTVKKIISERVENPSILDVYAGVSSFGIWLSDIASNITTIEQYPIAVEDAKENIKTNAIKNISTIENEANAALNELTENQQNFDVVLLDPPRKGCEQEVLNSVIQLASKYIIYVSCDPSTLARDVKFLSENGFTPEFVQPVDMFCHTYHIESIAVLKKCN